MNKIIIIDVDSIIINKITLVNKNNDIYKSFCDDDKEYTKLLLTNNYKIVFLTSNNINYSIINNYYKDIIKDIKFVKTNDKLKIVKSYKNKKYFIIYASNSCLDTNIFKITDLKFCSKDARFEIRYLADYITASKSGNGVIGDIYQILNWEDKKSQYSYNNVIKFFTNSEEFNND